MNCFRNDCFRDPDLAPRFFCVDPVESVFFLRECGITENGGGLILKASDFKEAGWDKFFKDFMIFDEVDIFIDHLEEVVSVVEALNPGGDDEVKIAIDEVSGHDDVRFFNHRCRFLS